MAPARRRRWSPPPRRRDKGRTGPRGTPRYTCDGHTGGGARRGSRSTRLPARAGRQQSPPSPPPPPPSPASCRRRRLRPPRLSHPPGALTTTQQRHRATPAPTRQAPYHSGSPPSREPHNRDTAPGGKLPRMGGHTPAAAHTPARTTAPADPSRRARPRRHTAESTPPAHSDRSSAASGWRTEGKGPGGISGRTGAGTRCPPPAVARTVPHMSVG